MNSGLEPRSSEYSIRQSLPPGRGARADDEAAVRQAAWSPIELFLADEVHRDVVLVEVVRHLDDLLLHGLGVGALLKHHPALARVLLARGQLRVVAGAHRIERGGHGDGVLARIGHAGDAAQLHRSVPGTRRGPQNV